MQFRRWHENRNRERFYVDLRPLKKLTPAGALLLTAEFDRWKHKHFSRLKPRDVENWDSEVRNLLSTMGFFDLLQTTKPIKFIALSNSKSQFLPFFRGLNCDGLPVLKLRNIIEQQVGPMKEVSNLLIYQAVSEAVTNVVLHAYKKATPNSAYWMSASIDHDENTITIMVLDHGLGIPRTLPQKGLNENESKRSFLKRLTSLLGIDSIAGFSDDARLIKAAKELGASQTGDRHRGHGLTRDIQFLTTEVGGKAKLRILSNKGCYVFLISPDAQPPVA